MGDFSNPEVDLGVGKVSEVSAEQAEQFQEQLAAAQAALAALQKEEGKSKKRDGALAGLLSQFVKNNQDPEVLRLIITCLNFGVPVTFIVGILSVHYADIYQELAIQLKKDPAPELTSREEKFLENVDKEEHKDLEQRKEFNEQHLPDEVKKKVNEWVRDILILSLENKPRVLTNVYPEGKLDQSTLQLTAKVLEKYLASVKIEGSFERIKFFAEFVLKGIGKELAKAK